MSQRVFVTSMGMISSLGSGISKTFESLMQGKTGFGKIEILETELKDQLPAFEIKLSDQELRKLAKVKEGDGFTRTALLAIIAIKELLESSDLSQAELANTGIISATTTGGIRELEKHYFQLISANQSGSYLQFADTGDPGEHTERMADFFGMRKYVATVSTACSSSANSLMLGAQLIRRGKLERAICGGSEALSKFTINGFNALMILDHAHCRPFDVSRKGLNLGEGAAYLLLESEQSMLKGSRTPLAELKGYGNANDAFHQTASSPDGAGAAYAMELAMQMGGLSSLAIDYINAHGTATENNDLSEGLAIEKLFRKTVPPTSSTKPYTGHTLAAAGSIESVFCTLSIRNKVVFPNLNYREKMPELSFEPEVNLLENRRIKNVLSNSFGFGGNTSSLLWSDC